MIYKTTFLTGLVYQKEINFLTSVENDWITIEKNCILLKNECVILENYYVGKRMIT